VIGGGVRSPASPSATHRHGHPGARPDPRSVRRPRPEYDVPAFEPYPRTNETKIVGEVEGYKGWPVHRPDLDMSRIVEFTKLQLWTLKPAHRRRGGFPLC